MKKSHQLARLNLVHFLLQFLAISSELVEPVLDRVPGVSHPFIGIIGSLFGPFLGILSSLYSPFPTFIHSMVEPIAGISDSLFDPVFSSASSLACTAHFPVSFTAHLPVSSQSLSLAPGFVPWPVEKRISYEISSQSQVGSFIISQRQ